MIAGFERPTSGRILLDGEDVANSPPHKRNVNTVFQSYALFPHLNVADNVAFGLKYQRATREERRARVSEALGMVQLADYGDRKPGQLSGGQQQRVAIARALVLHPRLMLFDEPLSNLDAKLRADMRIELRELQHRLGITSVYVTHDLEEALAMSDRIVVMRDGLIEQTGTPDEIYRLPNSAFVADFVGSANLIRGRHRADLDAGGLTALETSAGHIVYGMAYDRPVGTELVVSVRTVHLRISTEPPAATQNVWRVPVRQTVFQGDFTQVHLDWGEQQLIARCAAMEPLTAGQQVYITVEPRHVVVLAA